MVQLEKIFDFDHWGSLNYIVVGFGQQICAARNPKCGECLLNTVCSIGKKYTDNGSKHNINNTKKGSKVGKGKGKVQKMELELEEGSSDDSSNDMSLDLSDD